MKLIEKNLFIFQQARFLKSSTKIENIFSKAPQQAGGYPALFL